MATALYRINGGEVLKISPRNQPFAERDPAFWGVLVDPLLPDGTDVRAKLDDGLQGPLRVLGLAKIALAGSNTVRNATQPEIDGFAVAEQADEAAMDAEDARRFFDHPRFGKVFDALLEELEVATKPNPNQRRDRGQLRADVKGRVR